MDSNSRRHVILLIIRISTGQIAPPMSRNACNGGNGETGEKSPAASDLNWMPKVAPWRLAILAKMAILAKLAILAKIAMHAMAKMAKLAKNHQPLAI